MQIATTIAGFLLREGSAILFATLIWLAIWGGFAPDLQDIGNGMFHAAVISSVALVYLGLKAFAVVTAPLRRELRSVLNFVLSLIPMALIGYAAMQFANGSLSLNQYQHGVIWAGGLACMIDVIVYTWFAMKLNKHATEYVEMH